MLPTSISDFVNIEIQKIDDANIWIKSENCKFLYVII